MDGSLELRLWGSFPCTQVMRECPHHPEPSYTFPVDRRTPVRVGRQLGNDVCLLRAATVSRNQARVHRETGEEEGGAPGWRLECTGGALLTVNGRKLEQGGSVLLRHDDVIGLVGGSLVLRVGIGHEPSSADMRESGLQSFAK